MIGLYTPAAVRGMDERAFSRGVSPSALMERAAGHLARAIVELGGHGYGLRVGILAGKGNNGGDGLAAGRRLLDAGAAPRVCLVGGAEGLGEEGRAQLRRYRARGGRLADSPEAALADADVAVDCLLGTGASGPPRAPYDAAVEALNAAAAPVVACDLPTGVDAATGAVAGVAVRAAVTVTLGAEKLGLRLWPARDHCGRLVCGDLGIVEDEDAPAATLLEPADVAGLLPAPPPAVHKRARGVLVALAGSAGMTGAATLVGLGALAGGAGLVTVATAESARALVAPAIPEALTLGLPDDPEAAFERVAAAVERADALAIGPGLGTDEAAVRLVRRLVTEIDRPVVLDADGLTALSPAGDRGLADHAAPLLVLTPHAGELARLDGRAAAEGGAVWAERATLAPARAADWKATLVVKGPGSLVGAPDGRLWVNPTGSAALATGGTGDVLTGLLGALVAEHPEPDVVAAGVYLHGLAGELAGQRRTARGATAGDVARALPEALQAVSGASGRPEGGRR